MWFGVVSNRKSVIFLNRLDLSYLIAHKSRRVFPIMYQNSHHLAMALDIIYVALSAEGYQDLKRIWMMLKTKVGVAGSWGSCLATKLCWRNSDALAFLLVGLSVILPITTTLSIQSCAMLCGLKSHFTGNRPFSTMIVPEGYVIAITSIRLKNKQATEDQRRIIFSHHLKIHFAPQKCAIFAFEIL